MPLIFENFFTRDSDVHDRLTRSTNELRTPITHCKVGENFILKRGVKIWTTIPAAIDVNVSMFIFKKSVIREIVNEYS